ncbi:hypothetical protein RJ640_002206 [Escallonia rubra]|uniref:non-specific serine/threonine protein kinase n=1 Tax=Escallonia rubra TaxID=112253 RepID=A0AA88QV95_9ASTE|nr:hypothetical protein RJ640_002206 [Escallonia rubra]
MAFSLSILNVLWVGMGLLFGISLSMVNGLEMAKQIHVQEPSCPLNFDVLRNLFKEAGDLHLDATRQCQSFLQEIRLVRSEYLRTHGLFLPHSVPLQACWNSYRAFISERQRDLDIQSSCGYHPEWITGSCTNVRSKSEFERLIPEFKMKEVQRNCNQSLESSYQCSMCTQSLSTLRFYLRDPDKQNVTDCSGYAYMFVAASVNQFGPTNIATAKCLFSLQLSSPRKIKRHILAFSGALIGSVIGLFAAILAVWFIKMRNKKPMREKTTNVDMDTEPSYVSEFGTIGGSNLVKYKYREIRKATNNFSWENIIGRGKYGNVYRGILQDGSEVAVKRFKNCSTAGDGTFKHEVEVIASVKHVNLVALRGYCTATVPMVGHQRILVCDLIPNGSLYDHLFGSKVKRLSWPIRQKIALGTARGLLYLHYGAQPAIIHRDIKASNILLDEKFEPKLADFGLAKFNPKGMTHLSTELAGTLGYVAPEYALYGKLTKGSDVYSFGVVLLELLSGKKALISMDEEKASLLTDWAWSLVNIGRAMDVIEENMSEVGLPEVMEQYVLMAVLCCHPHLHARPTMDQIVKLLELKV